MNLIVPAVPNFPLPGEEYSRLNIIKLENVLRLYLNQLGDTLDAAVSPADGGKFLFFPHGAFRSPNTQYATASNTPTLVEINTTDFAVGMVHNNNNGIVVDQDGIYNLQFSLQFENTDNSTHEAIVWLRKNGTDLAHTASKFDVPSRKSALVYGYLIAVANFYVELNATDYVELWWATPQAYNPVGPVNGVLMPTLAAQTVPYPHPSSPSAVATLTFVSNIL